MAKYCVPLRKFLFHRCDDVKIFAALAYGERRFRAVLLAGALPLLLLLAACGGGGGSGESAAPSPAGVRDNANPHLPALPPDWETDPEVWAADGQFQNQPGLDTINAQQAYARGITGKDVTIGFVDTGLDDTHSEFADKTIRLNDRSGLTSTNNAQLRHGTGVASIALGARHMGSLMHGVAFDADPAMWSLRLANGFLDIDDGVLSRGITALQSSGARIINHSWGYSSPLDLNLHSTQSEYLETAFADTLALMRQRQAIHVWAAGNEGHDQVSISSAWPALFPDLAGFSIAVAALGADGAIGRGSNHCGAMRNHCLVAPGGVAAGGSSYTIMADPGGGYRTSYGTSYAAPYVSGVLALMMQAFGDQLTLPEYTARLLATANKSGIYENDFIYGQGLVDADAALRPYGDSQIPIPAGGLVGAAGSGVRRGGLPRDMIERLRREKIIILDELNTPFTRPLISNYDPYQSFEMTEWLTAGDNKTTRESHPFLNRFANVQDGTAISFWRYVPPVLRKKNLRDETPGHQGIGFAARLTRRRTRLAFGMVGEESGLMTSEGTGALSFGPSHSILFSYGYDMDLGDWQLDFDTHAAMSNVQGGEESLLRGTDRALASSAVIALRRRNLAIEVRQPTYFETGVLNLALPYKRQADGSVLFTSKEFSLSAPHRPVEMRLLYETRLGRLGMQIAKHADLPTEVSLGLIKSF